MMFRRVLPVALVAAALSPNAPVHGQNDPYAGHVLYGINRDHGRLIRYDFETSRIHSLGSLTLDNRALSGVNAAAYVPGFQNLFAFWYDASDMDCVLLYVDPKTAKTSRVFNLEGGAMTGAVAAPDAATGFWHVYATQQAELPPPFTVRGLVNINPNNSAQNEFTLRTASGLTLTRDDLHSGARIDGNGTAYAGEAIYIRFKPKGNGNQNGLLIDGQPYALQNSNTYTLNGAMTVRVYNDKPKNGKAMGHWWLEVSGGTAYWADAAVTTPRRLVRVDHHTGTVTELMRISRDYDGLASTDGVTFYATSGSKLWRLDPATESETLVGTSRLKDMFGLEFLGGTLTAFEAVGQQVTLMNVQTGQPAFGGVPIYAGDLGTIVYAPLPHDPSLLARGYD